MLRERKGDKETSMWERTITPQPGMEPTTPVCALSGTEWTEVMQPFGAQDYVQPTELSGQALLFFFIELLVFSSLFKVHIL